MDAWVWFVIAGVAGIAGVALLLLDNAQSGSSSRERRRWAALRGWQFAEADPVLPDRWRHGAMARGGGGGTARDLVTGSLFTAAGRRLVHVFDLEHSSGTTSVVAAVHRRAPQPVVLELWLPTVEFPADAGLDLLGPVGDRYAFTSDLVTARPLITPELIALADEVGGDVPVMWIEDAWVAAAVPAGTAPSRLERLLRMLGDFADLVDGVHTDSGPIIRARSARTEDGDEDEDDVVEDLDEDLDDLDDLDAADEPVDADEVDPDEDTARPTSARRPADDRRDDTPA